MTAWLAVLLSPLALEARALPLVAEWEESVITASHVGIARPGALVVLPEREQTTRHANAVLIGPGLAVTAAHCIRKDGLRLSRLLVGGKPAHVTAAIADLALLAVDPSIGGKPARLRLDRLVPPAPGAVSLHVWWNHDTGAVDTRVVTWKNRDHIRERFAHGMSGSGVYSLSGHLVGVAETADGMVLGPQEIAELLRIREMRNIE